MGHRGSLAALLGAAEPMVALGLFEGWLKWHWEQNSSGKDLCYLTSHQCLLAHRFELQCIHCVPFSSTKKGWQKEAAQDMNGNMAARALLC